MRQQSTTRKLRSVVLKRSGGHGALLLCGGSARHRVDLWIVITTKVKDNKRLIIPFTITVLSCATAVTPINDR
jgi:hypothetical protein